MSDPRHKKDDTTALRQQHFTSSYTEGDATVFEKRHDFGVGWSTNPIDRNEAQIQAVRYVQGMTLLAKNLSSFEDSTNMMSDIAAVHQKFTAHTRGRELNADDVLHLATDLAQLLANKFDISIDKGLQQLTMARDLGILLQDHPVVRTVTTVNDLVTTETSTPYKVSSQFYDKYIPSTGVSDQLWMASARKHAGFPANKKDNWLDNFFNNPENRAILVAKGVSAPPSARWLPIPANMQSIDIKVERKNPDGSMAPVSQSSFFRTGIAVPYDVRHIKKDARYAYQKKIAEDILKEVIRAQLEHAIINFKEKYDGIYLGSKPDFYVNYQTLLSPLIGEKRFGHVDNNARFVSMAKEIMGELANKSEFNDIANKYGVNLKIRHTNSAVNRNAKYTTSYKEDNVARQEKIDSLLNALNTFLSPKSTSIDQIKPEQIDKLVYSDAQKNELKERLLAAQCLQKLLNNESPYKKLKTYQRNIMMGALENLVIGAQGLNLAGCKSARDRTAVFANAVKVMRENPKAMSDWMALKSGIMAGLKGGHHFRSMISHSAIVKVALVHKEFMDNFSSTLKEGIKTLLAFSKKPDAYEQKEKPASFYDRVKQYLPKAKASTAMPAAKNDISQAPEATPSEVNTDSMRKRH